MKTILFLSLFFSNPSLASNWEAKGSGQLVELYTSEGCSSCPPADQWLSGLKNHPDLWKKVVPLSFHVDYWDGLGWPDKFARADSTARQRNYASAWNSSRVYTPGIVIQGKESAKTMSFENAAFHLEARWDGKLLTLSGDKIPEGATINFAWLGLDIKSVIKRGENAGKTLEHNFVVLNFGNLGLYKKNISFNLNMPAKTSETPKALAIWVEKDGIPVAATGGPLL